MGTEINYIEELWLRANEEVDARKYNEAKLILEEIIEIDPTYGRAYNHLGWIYAEILKIREKAEPLYKLAMKYAPEYGAPYINYLYLLLDRLDAVTIKQIVGKAKQVPDADKAVLDYMLARANEIQGDYKQAYKLYEQAKNKAFNDRFISDMNAQKQRVLTKMNRFQRVIAAWFW